jgi:transcriptional regulator with XRE-family HTH domain/tetratricopeptide (TPR) repeat protein
MEQAMLRAARNHKKWTIAQVAEHLDVSCDTVGRWERGTQAPRERHIQRLCEIFAMTPQQLGLDRKNCAAEKKSEPLQATLPGPIAAYIKNDPTMQLQAIVASPFAAVLFRPVEDILTQCSAGLSACELLSRGDATDMELAFSVLTAYIPTLQAIVKDSSVHRQAAAHLTTQALLRKALLSMHFEGPKPAITYANQAVDYAQATNDVPLHLATLTRLSWVYSCDNQLNLALETALQAKYLMENAEVPIPPLMRCRAYTRVSEYQALTGNRGEALLALNSAHKSFATSSADDHTPIYVDYSYDILLLNEARTHYFSKHPEEAMKSFRQIIAFEDRFLDAKMAISSDRVHSEILNYITLASLQLPKKDKDLSVRLWKAGLEEARKLRSDLRLNEVLTGYKTMLDIWPHERDILDSRGLIIQQ